ncbi:MAG: hypothetical protein SNJ75_03195 [Gemmataceae bacterium]
MNADADLQRVRATLDRYDEPLLREVAARLAKPRNHWPRADLIDKCLEVLQNPPVLDRRLADLPDRVRRLLALLARSRQSIWPLASLFELLLAFGEEPAAVGPTLQDLFEAGLLYPVLGDKVSRFGSFGYWMSTATEGPLSVLAPRPIVERVRLPESDLPDLGESLPLASPRLADGLDFLLRLGVLWQQVRAVPLRRTQGGGLFKRDVERLSQESLFTSPAADALCSVPDPGFLLAELAERLGVLVAVDGEVRAGALPQEWNDGLWTALGGLVPLLFRLCDWGPVDGYRPLATHNQPFASAYLLTLEALGHAPADQWVAIDLLQDWVQERHPFWARSGVRPSQRGPWLEVFLLGVSWPLRLVEATQHENRWWVRLSDWGRAWFLRQELPPPPPTFPKTLLLQPNLEILVYRQGLSPALLRRLTLAASWKTLGAACTLALDAETVYRALEEGETFESLARLFEQHGTRPTPPGVLELMRTWANKRERISVYPSATLLEFATARDLDEALARGVSGFRATDTVLVVASEDQIEFKHFRLAGSRDYSLPPEPCMTVDRDGVTLSVDLSRSDLLLETELPRIAELVERQSSNNRRIYRLTPESLARARESGWTANTLEQWFQQRLGIPATPAAKLLLLAPAWEPLRLRRLLILTLADPTLADGLEQWPATQALIQERIGPQAMILAEEHVDSFRKLCERIGLKLPETIEELPG